MKKMIFTATALLLMFMSVDAIVLEMGNTQQEIAEKQTTAQHVKNSAE